ncbi:hypothetical protein DPMN_110521 [Dreissena polymorpha]|uniref:Uncharacterized protein n=1 Tax=Dreissena polymorpha TaxID=45954 RepID=A0A9D4KC61_DREPO|nr:hypothetical protein DPMN_110521 [Dreissena polymorpha]
MCSKISKTTWQAIREVFPDAVIRGCVFYFTQRIYRKINTEGLSTAYQQHGDKFEFFRKIMSLPYLPVEQIEPAFNRLMEFAEEVGVPCCGYVSTFPVHGSTAVYGDLSIGACLERRFARTTTWKDHQPYQCPGTIHGGQPHARRRRCLSIVLLCSVDFLGEHKVHELIPNSPSEAQMRTMRVI